MIKRKLLALGLGVALLGGAATLHNSMPAHAASVQAVQADVIAGATEPQTAEADTGAADTGPDVQQGDQTGPDTGAADASEVSGPETDTVQAGDQAGQ